MARSLKQKLILRNTLTLAVLFLLFFAIFTLFNYKNYRDQYNSTKAALTRSLIARGESLVRDQAVVMESMLENNAYTDIQKMIATTANGDEDITYGGYVRKDFKPFARVTKTNPSGLVSDDKLWRDETTLWAMSESENQMRREILDGRIFEFAIPIHIPERDDLDLITGMRYEGALFYGLKTEAMQLQLAQQDAQHRQDQITNLLLMFSLGMGAIFIGYIFTRRQAATITHPLAVLTEASDSIAAGKYGTQVKVKSGDEIENLADSFNKMTLDLETTYANLRKKNDELLDARYALEDLNRHLEEKVADRTMKLADSEIKFRTLFEESADAILLGTEAKFLDCNPALLEMMGAPSKDAFLALSPKDISPLHQPGGTDSTVMLQDHFTLVKQQGSRQFEWLNKRMDGSEFYTEIVVTSFPLNDQPVMHMVFRDITERHRTEMALKQVQETLVENAHSAGMAEIATGVLHNIGNILNSVNISTEEIANVLKHSRIEGFLKANNIVAQHTDNLGDFFSNHPKGKLIPSYYLTLGEAVDEEYKTMNDEIRALTEKVSMMRDVISTQQSYAKSTFYTEEVMIDSLLEDSLKLQISPLKKQHVHITKRYFARPRCSVPKVKLIHVLTNLLKNSREAMFENDRFNKDCQLKIELRESTEEQVEIRISDNGCGIETGHLEKIFNHGFTTKDRGHGFGLHTCANFMTEMGGSLVAESKGEGQGSTFIVTFPKICKGPIHLEERETHADAFI